MKVCCPNCNHGFNVWPNPHRKFLTPEERFWEKVDKRGDDECWPWMASCSAFGHGQFTSFYPLYKERLSHRIAWVMVNGPIPKGLCALHECDNPPCCNPRHLFLGTKADNTQDMMKKGRHIAPRGEGQPTHKYSEQQVLEMLQKHNGGISRKELSRQYGISSQQLSLILTNKAWRHLPRPPQLSVIELSAG